MPINSSKKPIPKAVKKRMSFTEKYVLTIIVKPPIIQVKNEKCTLVIIVLYLPVFTSASRPNSGNERYTRNNPIP